MQKEALSLFSANIFSLDETQKVGIVKDFIIDPTNGQILSFCLQTGLVFKKEKYLSAIDVVDIKGGELTIMNSSILDNLADLPEISELKKAKIRLLGRPVFLESGLKVGRVSNFVFDFPSFSLVKVYIRKSVFKDLLVSELVLPAEKIIEITRKGVVISDDLKEMSGSAVPEIS